MNEVIETSIDSKVRIGKDILELISSAMYVEPLNAYREYIQNSADAIDQARSNGELAADDPGTIDILIDQSKREVRIRDNGAAIPSAEVVERLLAIGGSGKRGTDARGFRGVGRLASLGYCQRLTFRSRPQGAPEVTELTWDGRRLRTALADAKSSDLADVVAQIVDVSSAPADDVPDRFFEVKMAGIARQRGDRLLDEQAVTAYLRQVAPLAFANEFSSAVTIVEALEATGPTTELRISINEGEPLTRPHKDFIDLGSTTSGIQEVEVVEVPGIDGGLAALAWFAHHEYKGAIPVGELVKGVRVRIGNIQIGDHRILEDIFPETRFNSWTVGEVHIFDRRIVPNGRRDAFEASTHHANLVNHLSPVGRDVARRCRTSSGLRSKLREFDLTRLEVEERLNVVQQGAMALVARDAELGRVNQLIAKMAAIAKNDIVPEIRKTAMKEEIAIAEEQIALRTRDGSVDPLEIVEAEKRGAYRDMIELIYECSSNRVAAKSLVDRILQRLAA
ncbi:ATP-binding protein [Stakelama tenebrarum]|uniref:HSP90 family molecular chaperone-like protein n=1 Tax=Stakelama tenebrarum TaxID=2711215 RepID=A0A6G6Y1J2_9SPHN|nr:ATP-binding protein [Sphingosinithalassobacter tenebrarum]QIG78588.1 HSP90 family molecular chaperone-like protein [Sphingosinithalassobacter tenebrarum]